MFNAAMGTTFRLVPFAVVIGVLLSVTHKPLPNTAITPSLPASAPFDLGSTSTDPNGFAINPLWAWQQANPGGLVDPAICGGAPWKPPCTTQPTWIDNSWKCAGQGALGGHANWMPATYTGTAYWNSHSAPGSDDDYNIDLFRPDQAGLTHATERSKALANAPVLHMEFDSDETIDHFHSPWWAKFHAAVDAGDDHARAMLDGKLAIAVGLFGLDFAHSGNSELHPLFALAVRTNDAVDNDTWALFARNWGNEGYCGDGNEQLNTGSISFLIPRKNAVDVQIVADTFFFGPDGMNPAEKAAVSGPTVALVSQVGALVTFTLPPPQSGARINGILHLKWTTGLEATTMKAIVPWVNELYTARSPLLDSLRMMAPPPPPLPLQAHGVEPEAQAALQYAQLSARQKLQYRRLLATRPPQPDLGRLSSRRTAELATLPAPTMSPTATKLANPARDVLNRRKAAALSRAKVSPR